MPETWIGSGVPENITKAVKDVYKGVFSNPKLFTNITEIWKWVVNKIVNILKGLWNILTTPRFYASSQSTFPSSLPAGLYKADKIHLSFPQNPGIYRITDT